MKLNSLRPAKGSVKSSSRVGRGQGSGGGGTARRGHKGASSRSGYSRKLGFEGGQMPLQRRLPKFGFNNINRVEYKAINLYVLQDLIDKTGTKEITLGFLYNRGLTAKTDLVKILGSGEIKSAVSVKVNAFSKSAIEAIEKAGGSTSVENSFDQESGKDVKVTKAPKSEAKANKADAKSNVAESKAKTAEAPKTDAKAAGASAASSADSNSAGASAAASSADANSAGAGAASSADSNSAGASAAASGADANSAGTSAAASSADANSAGASADAKAMDASAEKVGANTGASSTTDSSKSEGGDAVKAASPKKSSKKEGDDLTVVEGIGPKINQLLNADGIITFVDLSKSNYDVLKGILDKGGPRYKMHNPSTWPQQAALAAEGKWDELKELQDKLSGGRPE